MKKLNRNTKSALAICAGLFVLGKDDATANASMQHAMPQPLNMKSLRRPNRSMVKKATKHERNFQVSAPPERMRLISELRPRPCWKMICVGVRIYEVFLGLGWGEGRTVEYVEIKLLPHICCKNCRKMHSAKR
jgi:hypothetical protein